MRIIFFSDTFLPQINGVVTSVMNFSKQLAKRGHEIHIFTTETKSKKRFNLGKNIYIHRFKSSSFLIDYPDFNLVYPSIVRTYNEVKKIKPHIIHTHTPSLHAWTALTLARLYNVPILSTYHTLLPDFLQHTQIKSLNSPLGKRLAWDYTRSFYNKVDMVITPSEAMKKELKKHHIKKPVQAVSNGIDIELFKPKKCRSQNLLHVGRISYEKNIDVILKAMQLVIKKDPYLHLDIVGSGPDLDNLKKISIRLGLKDNVTFKGPIPHEDLPKVYNSHDIFITASTIETEGLVILEAMACALPVIGVRKMAVPDIVHHNKNGYIADPGDAKKIAEFIIKLISNEQRRKKFGEESVKISKDFSLDKSIDRIEYLYNKLRQKR